MIYKKKKPLKIEFLNSKLNDLKNNIEKFNTKVPLYNLFYDKNLKTNSHFDIKIFKSNFIDNNKYIFKNDINYDINSNEKLIKCKKIILLPSIEQKNLLLDMLEGYRLIYNLTLKFIKTRYFLKKKEREEENNESKKNKKNNSFTKSEKIAIDIIDSIINNICKNDDRNEKIEQLKNNNELILDPKIIKTYFIKDEIHKVNKKFRTPVHTLNYAVQLACTSFKTCLTNLKNGTIKNFNVRYIKANKKSLIMDIEKTSINKKGFFTSILGKNMKNNQNIDYIVNNDCKLHYNKNIDNFTLLIPEFIEENPLENNNDYICIDPGLRTFMNCITNKNYEEIGNNVNKTIKDLLVRIDNCKTCRTKKLKEKCEKKLRERLKNKVDDLHWKIIHYLTNNYKNILIGKWSTKNIISKEDSVLNKMSKRIAQNISFYKFLQRLEYKCKIRKINLRVEEEWYTSKVCTNCGNKKDNLGGNKIYECSNCNLKIKKDYNGSRNILIKCIKTIE